MGRTTPPQSNQTKQEWGWEGNEREGVKRKKAKEKTRKKENEIKNNKS